MKEHPILFSAPMVRAILAGTKTQTRRVAKGVATVHALTGEPLAKLDSAGPRVACPYGQPGDRLWVRETWLRHSINVPNDFLYRADHPDDGIIGPAHGGWKPSIHMPRAASRILLEVVSVRVERLQAISNDDAQAEGVTKLPGGEMWTAGGVHDGPLHDISPVGAFRRLWQSINGPESWDANPWCWAVEFKHLEAGR